MIDVANEARVSQTTVSLVLNHADGARLSRRDARAGDEGRGPARLSAGAARRRAGAASATSIGFVCDEISTDPWTAIGLDGVREKAWEHGLTVTVMVTRGDADMESRGARAARRPAAARPRLCDDQHAPRSMRRRRRRRLPTVLLNCHAAERRAALGRAGRGRPGGHAATDVLIRAGHRRIGYINGEASMEAARHRLRGYRQALATADLPFDPDLVREGNWQPLSGYEATRALMGSPRRRPRSSAPTT